jgi:WD40 repeat protein
LAFDPTNRYLAAGEDQFVPPDGSGAVIVWDLKTRREVLHTKEQYRVFQVAFSASGDLICVGGGGGPSGLDTLGAITIRKAAKYDVARTIGTQCGVTALAVVPGVGVATGDWHGQVRLWDLATGRALAVANESGLHVNSLAASQDGKLLLSGDWDSTARLWRTSAAKGPK